MNPFLLLTLLLIAFLAGHTVALHRVRKVAQKQLKIYQSLLALGSSHKP